MDIPYLNKIRWDEGRGKKNKNEWVAALFWCSDSDFHDSQETGWNVSVISSSWRFHCNIQSLEAFVILNNVKVSNPLKMIWEGKEKKLVETCTWRQRRAVPNFSLCKFWGIPVERKGVLYPHHMPANLYMNLSCKTMLCISIMDQVLKVLLQTKIALKFCCFQGVFRDFFFGWI